MAYQDFFEEKEKRGNIDKVGTINGKQLLGLSVEAPLSVNHVVPILPLSLVSMDKVYIYKYIIIIILLKTNDMKKGTGIVTSVPSDAPDDYIGIQHLKSHPDLYKDYMDTETVYNKLRNPFSFFNSS